MFGHLYKARLLLAEEDQGTFLHLIVEAANREQKEDVEDGGPVDLANVVFITTKEVLKP